MELIKKHYKKIIAYGLIILGAIAFIGIFIIRPQKLSVQEAFNYDSTPTVSKITFPFSQDITILNPSPSYIEIYFGDDSINDYKYTIIASHNEETLYEHTYINEKSNVVRLPIDNSNLSPNDIVTVRISCNETCDKTKFELYDTENGPIPKIIIASYKTDYRYFWYATFLIVIGLTLTPLTKGKQ